MASLVLGAAGAALGSSLLGGASVLGITGVQIGGALGTLAGVAIDQALTPGRHISGPRLSDINIQASSEGAAIARLFGRMRLAGQVIWASRFRETVSTSSVGGKGLGPSVSETDYAYSISFAVGLCEGEATRLGRVWANGSLLDTSQVTLRFHGGGEAQDVDPLIADIEGGNAPAYRGLCYVVFEDMPLAAFGNRIPLLQFEVYRSLALPGSLEASLPGVALIPGAGEFVYAADAVFSDDGEGGTQAQNAHGSGPDIETSLDDLTALAPNLGAVSLVVGWFGDDLRAGAIRIRPGVEETVRDTYPQTWSVAGVAREDAYAVSRVAGRPAYGGTPSDDSVRQAIVALKARGLRVLFNPFLFLDIAPGNGLTDPVTGAAGQPGYPWRGRIRGNADDDATPASAAQVANFFDGTWGWRRMVLHYAQLCADAGGVDAFLIGSELVGLTRTRDGAASYPAVAALKTLAADVKAILPAAKIGYAADWSEYSNHQVDGGVLFNLDPLWADANIDFIGIDNYLPLADWRDGEHLDAALASTTWDRAYLAANIRGGEGYDWYYTSDADRAAQARTPITDGLGKPWVWRAKDFWNWWSNAHHDRPGGVESATPTDWVPSSKPIWFTELGCPAIDKGANQPNVFFDPKSSESAVPHFSSGARDDLIQRRFLEAHLAFWNTPANNPVIDGVPLVDTANIYAWCWDARPFPYFPALADVWGDAGNYARGHWLNGRLGQVPLGDVVGSLCDGAGLSVRDAGTLDGLVTGYAVTDVMSARDAIQPLAMAGFFDAVESDGVLRFTMRGRAVPMACAAGDLVLKGEEMAGFTLVRAQADDLPLASRVAYIDGDRDYAVASVETRRQGGATNRMAGSNLPLVLDQAQAASIGARWLADAWVMRDSARLALPPSALALEVGDELLLSANGRDNRLRVTQIEDGAARAVEAVATDPSLYEAVAGAVRAPFMTETVAQPGRPLLIVLDLPWLHDDQNTAAPFVGAYADPWPGKVAVMRSATDTGFALDATITKPCSFGVTTQDFWSGPTAHWDRVNSLKLRLVQGALSSVDPVQLLTGANALAIQNEDGGWEVVQFATAALTGANEYTLTQLKRGRRGSEGAMRDAVAAGARVVVLDDALVQLDLAQSQARQPFQLRWGPLSRATSDTSWQGASESLQAVALIPPAPCHIGFDWNVAGDLILQWKRRDRAPSASSLNLAVTPMSEAAELYDLEILNGASVMRSFSNIAQHSQTYTAAQQAADFPAGLPNPLTVAVYQRSSAIGRGRAKKEALYVR